MKVMYSPEPKGKYKLHQDKYAGIRLLEEIRTLAKNHGIPPMTHLDQLKALYGGDTSSDPTKMLASLRRITRRKP